MSEYAARCNYMFAYVSMVYVLHVINKNLNFMKNSTDCRVKYGHISIRKKWHHHHPFNQRWKLKLKFLQCRNFACFSHQDIICILSSFEFMHHWQTIKFFSRIKKSIKLVTYDFPLFIFLMFLTAKMWNIISILLQMHKFIFL